MNSHRRSHERVVARRTGSPDIRCETDHGTDQHDGTAAKAIGHGNPDEIAEAKDENGNTYLADISILAASGTGVDLPVN